MCGLLSITAVHMYIILIAGICLMLDSIYTCDIMSAAVSHISFSFPECNRYWSVLYRSG